jgi:DNA-binding MarR family transcriptional regulator
MAAAKTETDQALEPLNVGILAGMLGYMLRRAQLQTMQDFYLCLVEFELRPAEFSVLEVIRANPGARPSRIAEALGIKRTNFVPLINRLERRGLVTRWQDKVDRRACLFNLTAQGADLLARASRRATAHETALARRLGDGGASQLLGYLKEMQATGAPLPEPSSR